MAMKNEPAEPASDDDSIQGFLDGAWRASMAGTREAMEQLRMVVPEMSVHLPEVAFMRLESALADVQSAYRDLHLAGPHVIGQTDYDAYLEAQTSRTIGGR